jgi:hypothetical protein
MNFKKRENSNPNKEDRSFSPSKSSKNLSRILGNLTGVKASRMIPLSSTEIIGLSSSSKYQ